MDFYSKAAMERTMKIQEVLLRALARRITWFQAAEILGFSDRHVRRIREGYEEFGYDGLLDRRRGKPSPKRVALATVETVLGLYQEKYFDLNVSHFHEKLKSEHQIDGSQPRCHAQDRRHRRQDGDADREREARTDLSDG